MAIDEEQILRAKALDLEALEEVAEYLMKKLPPFLKSNFPDLPYDDAEDATMVVLEKFLKNPMSIRAKNITSLFAWAKKVGSNYLIDLTRLSESKNQSLSPVNREGDEIELPHVDRDYQEKLAQIEEKIAVSSTLQGALDALSPTDKYIVYEHHLAERSLEAIAKDLEMKVDAVKQRKKRALHTIKEILNSQGITYNSLH